MSEELIAALAALISLLGVRMEYAMRQLSHKMDLLKAEVDAIRNPDIVGVREETRKLVTMHEHADDYGFGSKEMLANQDRAFKEVTRSEQAMLDLIETVRENVAASKSMIDVLRDSMLQRSKLIRKIEGEE